MADYPSKPSSSQQENTSNVPGETTTDALNSLQSQVATGLVWQNPVKDRYDPTGGLPTPTDGDRYLATATANGWTKDNIYQGNGSGFDEVVPVSYTHLTLPTN